MWIRRVQQQGSSLVVVVPATAAKALKLSRGDYVTMVLGKRGWLCLTKAETPGKKGGAGGRGKA